MWGLMYEPWLIGEEEVGGKIGDKTAKPQEESNTVIGWNNNNINKNK